MRLQKILSLLSVFLLTAVLSFGQTTTSSVTGSVKNSRGENLAGATVTVTNNATGVTVSTSTDSRGNYAVRNLRPGGPYTITTSFVGLQNGTENDVYLNLGDNFVQNFSLSESTTQLSTVVVTAAARTASGSRGGAETNIGRDKMQNLPSVGRNVSDYLRYVPQAKVTADGGVSLAGQNNRYNAFYIDGAVNNDVFGLAASGTNGGQAGISPISIDAIDQFQVVLSPYDLSLGNFTGGGINACLLYTSPSPRD